MKKEVLLPLLVALAGLLLCVLLDRVYPAPILSADAPGYLSAVEGGWGRMYRTSAYGHLIQAGIAFGTLKFVTWFQVIVWCILLYCMTFVCGRLLRSAFLGVLVTFAFVFYEVQQMILLPYHWHILTEALVTDATLLGLLGLAYAFYKRSTPALFLSVFCLGCSMWLKPVPILLIVALPFIFLVLRPQAKNIYSMRLAAIACFLLCTPLVGVSLYNGMHYGSFSLSPVGGLNLVSHTEALYQDGDIVFDDAEMNRAFADVMRTGSFEGKDVIAFPMEHRVWGSMRAFFDAHSHETDIGRRVFTVSSMITDVWRKLVFLHPTTYAKNVLSKAKSIVTLDQGDDIPWRNGIDGIMARHLFLLNQVTTDMRIPFHGLEEPALAKTDVHAFSLINRMRFLSDDALVSSWLVIVQVALVVFALIMSIVFLRSKDRGQRSIGILIAILFLTGILSVFFTASLIFIDENDSRYLLPAGPCMSLAVILACAATCVPRRFLRDVVS